ncbi:MAG: hypothetical protein COB33_000880 [Thiotrichaceae bacterium]|nr:hypothetical protein [Thiotrichaceae bacterium]
MSANHMNAFAANAAQTLIDENPTFQGSANQKQAIQAIGDAGERFTLNLTPFATPPQAVSAHTLFNGVNDVSHLLAAYQRAKHSLHFEMDLPAAAAHVSTYADDFLNAALAKANATLNHQQAKLIANWVKNLDIYCAVKSIESFFYSKADLTLLAIAPKYGWDVVFDHLAIRCGNQANRDAERVTNLLKDEHGYSTTQFSGEDYYQFPDGWNAYPVYKMLENGQALRIFVDQSDAHAPAQIIQHWNHVYGYTAHHLAIRATTLQDGMRIAVPLQTVMTALEEAGVKIMTPTGHYTNGLLMQVFAQPEKNIRVPDALKEQISAYGKPLSKTIENAKLLEIVSRLEMKPELAKTYFALYDIQYHPANPLHSAPYYQYFLPAQAAHVIKTSQQIA